MLKTISVVSGIHGFERFGERQVAFPAIHHNADYFLTNDAALRNVKGVKVLVLDDYLPQA